jgi:hypothetical protein
MPLCLELKKLEVVREKKSAHETIRGKTSHKMVVSMLLL